MAKEVIKQENIDLCVAFQRVKSSNLVEKNRGVKKLGDFPENENAFAVLNDILNNPFELKHIKRSVISSLENFEGFYPTIKNSLEKLIDPSSLESIDVKNRAAEALKLIRIKENSNK